MLEAILIGGANGAGKTTLARQLLPLEHPGVRFLNADEIQLEAGALMHPVRAGRALLERLQGCVQQPVSFAIESTLASVAHAKRIPSWQANGYRVILYFIELPSADLALRRVARRVAEGGHGVPDVDVRRRFSRGLHHFKNVYKPLADEWYHWLSDAQSTRLIDYGSR